MLRYREVAMSVTDTTKVALSIHEVCSRYDRSRGTVFALMREGKLQRAKDGSRTLIPATSAESW